MSKYIAQVYYTSGFGSSFFVINTLGCREESLSSNPEFAMVFENREDALECAKVFEKEDPKYIVGAVVDLDKLIHSKNTYQAPKRPEDFCIVQVVLSKNEYMEKDTYFIGGIDRREGVIPTEMAENALVFLNSDDAVDAITSCNITYEYLSILSLNELSHSKNIYKGESS